MEHSQKHRNITVDLLRTFAIVLMVIFHGIYDLKVMGYVGWDIPNGSGWKEFRYLILSLFFLCVGVGLSYAHSRAIQWRAFWRRELFIVCGAVAVTLMSLVMFPNQWIYFGVLHFIALASLLTLPLIRHPKIAAVLGGVLLLGYNLAGWPDSWPLDVLANRFPALFPDTTADWVPLMPWLALVWLGVFMANTRWLQADPLAPWPWSTLCLWPGRHSLAIYLLHQPVLMGMLYGYQWLNAAPG